LGISSGFDWAGCFIAESRGQKEDHRIRYGVPGIPKGLSKTMNGDELDAVSGALVGRLHLQGRSNVLGNFGDGAIVLPKPNKPRSAR
jgi:hypothetical protein